MVVINNKTGVIVCLGDFKRLDGEFGDIRNRTIFYEGNTCH